ncbi:MAG: hypothetical protein ACRC6T_12665 [Sarcina sp.]
MNINRIIKLLKIDLAKCFSHKIIIVVCFILALLGCTIPLISGLMLPLIILSLSMKDLKTEQFLIDINLTYNLPIKKSELVIEKFLLQFLCMLVTLPAYIYIATVSVETAIYIFLITVTSSMIFCSVLTVLMFVTEPKIPIFIAIMSANLLILTNNRFILYLDLGLPLDAVPFATTMLIITFIIVPLSIFISTKLFEKKEFIK